MLRSRILLKDEEGGNMALRDNLKSFVAMQERKFRVKVQAASQGRLQKIHGGLIDDSFAGLISSQTYRGILDRKYPRKATKRHGRIRLYYVLTPQDATDPSMEPITKDNTDRQLFTRVS